MAYKNYYFMKGFHRSLRYNALERRAEAIAEQGNVKKATVLKCIRDREKQ